MGANAFMVSYYIRGCIAYLENVVYNECRIKFKKE